MPGDSGLVGEEVCAGGGDFFGLSAADAGETARTMEVRKTARPRLIQRVAR
jgi:hypothetical protein